MDIKKKCSKEKGQTTFSDLVKDFGIYYNFQLSCEGFWHLL